MQNAKDNRIVALSPIDQIFPPDKKGVVVECCEERGGRNGGSKRSSAFIKVSGDSFDCIVATCVMQMQRAHQLGFSFAL